MVALNEELIGIKSLERPRVEADLGHRDKAENKRRNLLGDHGRRNFKNLPVPVLAEPSVAIKSLPLKLELGGTSSNVSGEARESNRAAVGAPTDSRGGQKDLSGGLSGGNEVTDAIHSLPLAQSNLSAETADPTAKKAGRPPKAVADLAQTPDAIRMRKVHAARKAAVAAGVGLSGRGIRYESGRARCGFEEVGHKLLSDFEVDVAMRYFWGKRDMVPPGVTHGGVTPSAIMDFEEELTILQLRTSI